MRYGLIFLLLGIACGCVCAAGGALWSRLLTADAALCFTLVGAAYLGVGPGVFGKRANGSLPLLAYVLFRPYLLLNVLSLGFWAILARERPYHEVASNLYLGRRLLAWDPLPVDGFTAVLDVTCEFPERADLRRLAYLCLPLLDSTAPSAAQLVEAVGFVRDYVERGPVLIHCALGHGRSATVAAAYLVSLGLVPDADAAEAHLKARRPGVHLSSCQREVLRSYLPAAEAMKNASRGAGGV
jgi:hypothetical protein